MTKKWLSGLLWTLMFTAALQGQSRESVLKAVQETSEWTPAGQPVLYDEKNIAVLAGKRAPAIHRYGVTGATVQNWTGPLGNVRLTLYEMLEPSAAYGLFTLERNPNQPGFATIPVGTEGFRAGNRVQFWQSKYFVKLEGDANAAEDFARTISENIFGRSRKPPVSAYLPPANLVPGSDKYVVEASGIDRELNLKPEALGFDDSVEIATAAYRVDGKTAHIILLLYPTQQLAKKYEEQWASDTTTDAGFRKRVGAVLALVRGSTDASIAKIILDGVNYETQVTWDQPTPDLNLAEVILTIFSFIGMALIFTVVVGLSFGGLRVFMKARYPGRLFDRPEDMEIIQLKLGQGLIHKELRE